MNKFFSKKIILYFVIVFFIFLSDRISKIYILSILENFGNVNININSYINLVLVWNSGIAFGLLSFDQSEIYNLITIFIIFINIINIFIIILFEEFVTCKIKFFKCIKVFVLFGRNLNNIFIF